MKKDKHGIEYSSIPNTSMEKWGWFCFFAGLTIGLVIEELLK